jgi:hypothetical protein
MDPYIYINNHSLSRDICRDIIAIFEKTKTKRDAATVRGVNKTIFNAVQCPVEIITDSEWTKIHEFLKKELYQNISIYAKQIDGQIQNGTIYKHIAEPIIYNNFHINKYDCATEGHYNYHIDHLITPDIKLERHITFIWYLNDVEEGGETEVKGEMKIKPETGKLLLFPSTWTYPHTSRRTISNDKYVIVGWLMRKIL